MADLTYIEKRKLEEFMGMGTGFVFTTFTNPKFREFVCDTVGIDIYGEKYGAEGSKATRLRRFWDIESNYTVAKLLTGLAEYYMEIEYRTTDTTITWRRYHDCLAIIDRLKGLKGLEDVAAIKANDEDDSNFERLAQSIRDNIEKDEPDVAMDRLHTFLAKYVRVLCRKRGIMYSDSTPLNGIFGSYVKHLKENKLVETEMTLRILSTSIGVLEHFNSVRNNQSFAHPNTLLNYEESLLIFKYVAGMIKFLDALEIKLDAEAAISSPEFVRMRVESVDVIDDLPF